MADYWKSQPKKFCQYCKCWIADNKPSVEFHERGKNHKQNVAAKIEEIKKKSMDQAKKEDRMSKEFAAMEEAAMKAYEEDMKRLQAESGVTVEPQSKEVPEAPSKTQRPQQQQQQQQQRKKQKRPRPEASNREADAWVEGLTDDGHIYYYNTGTGDTQWDKPEGFQGPSQASAQDGQQNEVGSPWMEAVSPDGFTYYYNTDTGESSWEKPADFPSHGNAVAEVDEKGEQDDPDDPDDPSPPKPSPLSENESSSNGEKPSGEAADQPDQPRGPKISFRKRKEEKTEGSDEEKEDDEGGAEAKGEEGGGAGEESEQDKEKKEETPAKKPRINPYGLWECIQQEANPYENVDLQLPQVDTGGAAAAPTELPPEPKPKFRERTITSLGDDGGADGGAGATFRKRKTDNGKSRSLRRRGKDD